MTLQEIYDLATGMGIQADPRGKEKIKKLLDRTKKEYFSLEKNGASQPNYHKVARSDRLFMNGKG